MAKKRKTRQEKIIADLRRQLQTQVPQVPTKAKTVTAVVPTTYSLPKTKPSVSTINHKPLTISHDYVLSDLKKTVLFTIIALAAQIGISFVLMR